MSTNAIVQAVLDGHAAHIPMILKIGHWAEVEREFAEICERTPGLSELQEEVIRAAIEAGPLDEWGIGQFWYGRGRWTGQGIRARVIATVGWCAPNPGSTPERDYDVSTRWLHSLADRLTDPEPLV